ncbi:MAG: DUF1326 domain-containing protein [Acidobacteria bacterium]|nr:DUF1326 domain-containing protein [Acidobacteriota bacterium]MBI3279766.1 DUF1326 domain-containing protein [Acidobacteriota bacterium]
MWRIEGEEVAACNCNWGCPCQFNGLPTTGRCEGMAAWQIERGHYGAVPLDGLRFALVCSWPGPIHEGNGTVQAVIDRRATREQLEALLTLMNGGAGGTFFEVFSSVCPNKLESRIAAIELSADRERRRASVRIPGMLEVDVEPIRNPVTGEEHRARIDLPNGFEYKQAEVANAVRFHSTCGPALSVDHSGTHAHLNRFEWTNA